MGLPVTLLVFAVHEKPDVVYETVQDLLLLLSSLHYPQKLTSHVLAGLTALAELVFVLVVELSVQKSSF